MLTAPINSDGPVILLGPKNTFLDWSKWYDLTQAKLGRKCMPGERLSRQEWKALGYVAAGENL